MRSFIYIAVSAFAALAVAQRNDNAFNVPSGGYDFTAGEPTTLNWNPTTSGTITLKLQIGKNVTPDSGEVIAENIPNSGTFSFVPPKDFQPGTEYSVEIIEDNNPDNYNFTPTFTIDGSPDSQTTSAGATTTSEAVSTTTADATTTAETTETDSETTTTMASSAETSGTTMVTTSSASGTATTTATGTDSESTTGTSTADTTAATTTAPGGAGASLKVQGSMFAIVAAAMAAL